MNHLTAGPSRSIETAYVLAFAFLLSLTASVAQAAPVTAPLVQRIGESVWFAGSLGGLVGALAHAAALTLAPAPASARDIRRAVIEGVFSVIVGAIAAHYLTGQVTQLVPRIDPADRLSVGFGLGVLAWRAAPGVLALIKTMTAPGALKGAVWRALLRAVNAVPKDGGGPA